MKHVSQYIIESLFDDALDSSDKDMYTELISKLFKDSSITVDLTDDGILVLAKNPGPMDRIIKLNNQAMKTIKNVWPGFHGIRSGYTLRFNGVSLNSYVDTVESNYMIYIDNCSGMYGVTLKARSMNIVDTPNLAGTTLSCDQWINVDGGDGKYTFTFTKASITANMFTVTDFKDITFNGATIHVKMFRLASDAVSKFLEGIPCKTGNFRDLLAKGAKTADAQELRALLDDTYARDAFSKYNPGKILGAKHFAVQQLEIWPVIYLNYHFRCGRITSSQHLDPYSYIYKCAAPWEVYIS